MSHFTVLVLLRSGESEARITELLAPYDENMKAEPYDKACWCVGLKASALANDEADKGGSIDELRASFWKSHAQEEGNDVAWKAHIASWQDRRDAFLKANVAMAEAPDAECEECGGTGKYQSTYNPKSKWDWYRIGGRWDGAITGNRQRSEGGFNFDQKHQTYANNHCAVSSLPEDFTSFAVVTPDGEWHEHGKMGWWVIVSDEKADWPTTFRVLMSAHADCSAVLLDCHI